MLLKQQLGRGTIWPAPAGATLPSPARGGILDGFPWEIPDKGTRQPNGQTFHASHSVLGLNCVATTTRTTGCKGVLAIVTVQPTGPGNNGYAPNCFSCKNRWQLATCHSPLVHLLSSLASNIFAVLHSNTRAVFGSVTKCLVFWLLLRKFGHRWQWSQDLNGIRTVSCNDYLMIRFKAKNKNLALSPVDSC